MLNNTSPQKGILKESKIHNSQQISKGNRYFIKAEENDTHSTDSNQLQKSYDSRPMAYNMGSELRMYPSKVKYLN